MKPIRSTPPNAFSLMELIVVFGLLAVLLLIALPGLRYFRERSQGIACMANLRQIGAATLQYAGEHRNQLPFIYYVTDTGAGGSGALTGTWYYNLAPYLGVPRTEAPDPLVVSSERTRLGTPQQRIERPCVFTCPGHRVTESGTSWQPHPMSWPSERPVSYAPPLNSRSRAHQKGLPGVLHPSGAQLYPVKLSEIPYPAQKIWISDSPSPETLNTSANRWQSAEDYPGGNHPRQGFTRHNDGGNALFFDGHVEWLPLSTFITGKTIHTGAINRYFATWRDPALDP
ncbi:MAG TPA: DUF1559 domain-containing protein [Chthoniobacteraceae bacterium]|nr:DUF1559 domain-containing protein [Chthoniobacteraceae bacterium]